MGKKRKMNKLFEGRYVRDRWDVEAQGSAVEVEAPGSAAEVEAPGSTTEVEVVAVVAVVASPLPPCFFDFRDTVPAGESTPLS